MFRHVVPSINHVPSFAATRLNLCQLVIATTVPHLKVLFSAAPLQEFLQPMFVKKVAYGHVNHA